MAELSQRISRLSAVATEWHSLVKFSAENIYPSFATSLQITVKNFLFDFNLVLAKCLP